MSHGSGDFVIAFSTANRETRKITTLTTERTQLQEKQLTPFFGAVVEATEEAIVNALCMATTMTGRDKHKATALPIEKIGQL